MIRVLIITLIVFAFTFPVFAAEVELPSTGDVLVMESNPTTNYNHLDFATWGRNSNGELWAFIEFGGLAGYAGITLNSSVLSVFMRSGDDLGTDENRLRRITGDWEETTVTWNTRPSNTTPGELVFNDIEDGIWLELDVTAMVQDWLDGTYPNYGFCFLRVSSISAFWQFYTKEYSNPDFHPKLTLDYTSPVESTSLGTVKAAFK